MRTIKVQEKFKAFRKRAQWIYVSCPATRARVFSTSPQLVALSIASNFRGNCGQYLIGCGMKFDDTRPMLNREVRGIQRTWLKWKSDNVLSWVKDSNPYFFPLSILCIPILIFFYYIFYFSPVFLLYFSYAFSAKLLKFIFYKDSPLYCLLFPQGLTVVSTGVANPRYPRAIRCLEFYQTTRVFWEYK